MSLSDEEIEDRVNYHPPTPAAVDYHTQIRADIARLLESIRENTPACREQSIAITKIEEAMFWANAAIARNHDKL